AAAKTAVRGASKEFYQQAVGVKKYFGGASHVAGISGNQVQSPWDVTDNGGPVITKATSWNLYINCPTTPAQCWGTGNLTPKTFIQDFNRSSMLDVSSQYLHEIPNGHFGTVNELAANVTFANNTVTADDLVAIIHAASAATTKSGYDQMYHIFLPAGTDVCLGAGDCYSPDDPSSFQFCAFHTFVHFSPHWPALFTVEPFQRLR